MKREWLLKLLNMHVSGDVSHKRLPVPLNNKTDMVDGTGEKYSDEWLEFEMMANYSSLNRMRQPSTAEH